MDVNNNNKNGNGGANNPPNPGNENGGAAAKAALKKWRAKRDCIYQKAYVTAGTVVKAAEMKNTNFEEVKN
jgi:hypothetical protein